MGFLVRSSSQLRRGIAHAAIVALAATALLPARAARAERLLTTHCNVGEFSLHAVTRVRSVGTKWLLYGTRYRLLGGYRTSGAGYPYGYSNLNMQVISDDTVAYSYESPDNRVADGRRYRVHHRTRVAKAAVTYVSFEAIFDIAWASDPRCFAETKELPDVTTPPEPAPPPAPPVAPPPAPVVPPPPPVPPPLLPPLPPILPPPPAA